MKIDAKLLQSDTVEKLRRHYKIQNAFTENQSQTNFIVEYCRVVFEIKFHEYHDEKQFFIKHKCSIFSFCIFNFLDSQINDATFMFQKIFNYVFFIAQFVDDSVKIKIVNKLKNFKIRNEIMINIMKLNKIFFVFFYQLLCSTLRSQIFLQINAYFYTRRCCVTSMNENSTAFFKYANVNDARKKNFEYQTWCNFHHNFDNARCFWQFYSLIQKISICFWFWWFSNCFYCHFVYLRNFCFSHVVDRNKKTKQ